MTDESGVRASSMLNAGRRSRELDALASADEVDLLVIGGGVTGVGVALDAASRGLSVVLAEARDLAFGTSRWSSKLVHGGLRYLASGDFAVARESALERHLLMTRIAPHLIRTLPQLLPFVDGVSAKQRFVGGIGLWMGDGLRRIARTPSSVLPHPHRATVGEAVAIFPALSRDGIRGGIVGTDGQLIDDARLVVAIARTAAAHGAMILTRTRATDVDGSGATLHDELGGGSLRVRARAVVNAAGVWAGQLDPDIRLRPSRGTHIVLDAATLGNPTAALTVPQPGSISRFVFALPTQLGRVIVGLTDVDAPGQIPDVPTPAEDEIDFLLTTLSRALDRPLTRSDVRGSFAGLRPLIESGAGGSTADISRRHHVEVSPNGAVGILGGKLTTYRAMAKDAVDLALRHAGLDDPGCRTDRLPLVGAPGSLVPVPDAGARRSSATLRSRYGTEAAFVLAGFGHSGAERVAEGIDVIRAEVAFAVRAEGALDADDVLDRRTRIGLVPDDRVAAADVVAEVVAETLDDLST
ncbi:glycerol-3-phosphate dehydrogenase/oxidase [Microbacterium sp. Bi121]|uniref:glycerol-3-phosphate dehydrogenase/oxidase n=1 Tax=Microbacterium sp. Bi121 TaxID=2822348 RepID=UPI001D557895|nr:glycerol-3-phosphate dehydrogenase/oxidase [Microbacterium sp. Bi121]CAH0170406.1 Glycerol-3-phosphate dehydrogenase 1 [Microbacterium sp. Bi121]